MGALQEMRAAVSDVTSGRLLPAGRTEVLTQVRMVAKSYLPTRDRYRQNGDTFRKICAVRGHQLWLELATMFFRNADGIGMILEVASQIERE
jgi:hypothetical protein